MDGKQKALKKMINSSSFSSVTCQHPLEHGCYDYWCWNKDDKAPWGVEIYGPRQRVGIAILLSNYLSPLDTNKVN